MYTKLQKFTRLFLEVIIYNLTTLRSDPTKYRDRGTNGNEIGENITIIKGKYRYGIYVFRTSA